MHRLVVVVTLAACGGPSKKVEAPAPPEPVPAGEGAAPAADHPTFSKFDIADNKLVLPGAIVFGTGNAEIDEDQSKAALWYIHDYLEQKDYVTLVRIEGHTDTSGKDAMYMTGDRALNVGRWLVAHGIKCERMIASAFGDSKPVADPSTPEGKAQNRRIEVVNAELRGKAIGGMPVDGSAPATAKVCD